MGEPTHEDPAARARLAMGHLREANRLLAEVHGIAARDVGENFIGVGENSPRNNRHVLDLARAWIDPELEFRRASELAAPTIDGSLRLADIESIGERLNDESASPIDNTGFVSDVSSFDLHVHQLFKELQRAWPELEAEPPLEDHQADHEALHSPLRLAFRHHPLRVMIFFGVMIFVLGNFVWVLVK